MKKFLMICAAVSSLLFSSCTEDPKDSRGKIVGLVLTEDSVILPGASVDIPDISYYNVVDNNGYFYANDVKPGVYAVKLSCYGYVDYRTSIEVEAGKTTNFTAQMTAVDAVSELEMSHSNLNFGTSVTEMSMQIKNVGNRGRAFWNIDCGDAEWLSVYPQYGYLDDNESETLRFSVNRAYLASVSTVTATIRFSGRAYNVSVSCAPANATSNLVIEPEVLNFGNLNTMSMTLRNAGTKGLTWTSSNLPACLSLSASSGYISGGSTNTVLVTIDRSVSSSYVGSFVINDGVSDHVVNVNASGNGTYPGTDPDDDPIPGTGPVVTGSLTSYYKFENDCYDSYGYNDGNGVGISYVTGVDGKAVKLGNKDSQVRIPEPMVSTSFSTSFWCKGLGSGVIYYSSCSDNKSRFMLTMEGGKLWYMCSAYDVGYRGPGGYYANGTTEFTHNSIQDGSWHHVVVTSSFDTSYNWTNTLYIDGRKVDVLSQYVTTNGGESKYPTAFSIGGSAGGYDGITGTIDNFRIYKNRCLTAAEVREIYNARQ